MMENPDAPVVDGAYEVRREVFLQHPALKRLLDRKWLKLGRSRRGERMELQYKDSAELKKILSEIIETL